MTRRLVARAQEHIAPALRPGALALDATVGRGGDTAFLARHVGPSGGVLGLDIQRAALVQAGRRLAEAGLADRVTLRRIGHSHLGRVVPGDWPGRVAAVMFNLGYLPGGDRRRTTQPATTWAALEVAASLLAPGGRMSVLAYRGHSGGVTEAEAVARWAEQAGGAGLEWRLERPPEGEGGRAPWWLIARRSLPGEVACPTMAGEHGGG